MKAFVKVKPESGGVEYRDWEVPEPKPDEVLIQVAAAGLCGTDIHLYDWADNIVKEYKPVLPLVMGHEFAGSVVEAGARVDHFSKGDPVTVFPVMYCGNCYFCRNGLQNICDNRPLLGLGRNGAFAEFVSVPARNVYKLDEKVSFELGSLSELACVALHAIDRIRLTSGDAVAVVGSGPLGLMMAIFAKHSGATQLFVTGLAADKERLEVAAKIGAIPIEVDSVDPGELIRERTDGRGADVVFETAGSPPGVIQALNLVRKGGRISILGQGHDSTAIPTAMLSFREVELVGTRAYTAKDWQRVSRSLLAVEKDLEQIITHRLPLARAEEGIKLMKAQQALKIILQPSKS